MEAGAVPGGAPMGGQPMAGVQGGQSGTGQPPINISISEEMKAGVYANAASSSVTANELILDFGYIVPNEQPMTVKVVSRVNMSIKTAESLVQLLQGSISDYYNKVSKAAEQVPAAPAAVPPQTPPPAAPHAGAPIPNEGMTQ